MTGLTPLEEQLLDALERANWTLQDLNGSIAFVERLRETTIIPAIEAAWFRREKKEGQQ